MTHQNQQLIQKNPATYTLENNKLRVMYLNGVESVMFEDIASISFKEISNPNPIVSLICTFIGFGLMAISGFSMDMLYLGIGIIILGIILMFFLKIEFDNVIVETRGGKMIAFSVDFKTARGEMDHIENAKRDWELSK